MKKVVGLTLMLLFFSVMVPSVKAQTEPSSWWAKTYGGTNDDWAKAVAVTPNGDVIVVGETDSFGAGGYDAWVLRLDANGNVKWVKTYGGSSYDRADAVAIAPDGDIIVAGETTIDDIYGSVWVLRLDENGDIKWQKTYDMDYLSGTHAITVTDSGNIIVVGAIDYDFATDRGYVWILCLDSNGNVKWQRTYAGIESIGARAVTAAESGDIIVAGYIESTDPSGAYGAYDVWVLRLDPSGNVKWQKTYGGDLYDGALAVALATDGDIIVAGATSSFGSGDKDFWVLRLDESGNVKWQKTYGGNNDDEARAVAIAPNGDIIVAGYTWSFGFGGHDVWVLRLDENGNVKWGKAYWGDAYDTANGVAIANNEDIVVVGETYSFGSGDDLDAWVLRLPPDGDLWDCEFCSESNPIVKSTNAIVRTINLQVIYTDCIVKSPSNVVITTPVLQIKTVYQKSWGTLRVSSIPSQASVYINGEYKGETPLTLEIETGAYDIRISKADYQDYITTVTVESRETKTINAELTPAFGYLTIESSPSGAEVYVDGSYKGTTPITLELSPVGHKVKIKKEGYEDYTKTVTVEAGKSVSVSARLVAIPISQETSPERQQPSPTTSESTHTTTVQTGYQEPTGSGRLNRTMVYLVLIALALLISLSVIKRKRREVSIKFGKLTFSIVEGNIIHFPAEAIVNSVDKYLSYKGGVSRHVAKAAVGDVNKYREISRATMKKQIGRDWIRHGEVVVTPPFRLKRNGVKYVINTFGPDCKARWNKELEEILKLSIIAALRKADELGVERVAFPPIRAGASGCPFKHVVKTFLESVEEFSKEAKNIKEIFLVLLTKKDYDTALEILREWKRKEKRKESALGKHKSSKEEIVFQNKGFPSELSDNYAPLEFIGEGGFAKVFKVKRKSDGKIVALKIPRIDEKTSSLFLKEIAAWYHLDHPNIVRLYKADILPVPYLEMEYVEGVSLNGKPVRDLDKYPKPVDEKTALKLVKAIANGLAHAHSKGIWHLDMKPLNVLLKSDLTPKITDWGLAKISSRSSLSTHKGYSPLYAAPEQLDEDLYETPDHRTDIYQLGVIFYELLTGKLPYKGYSPGAVIGKILAENIKALPPSKINPALAKYDGIFEKLLAKRKEDRYQSVGEFLSALDSLEELHKELEELKKTKETLKRSRSKEEIQRLKREAVGKTTKIAILSAKLNDKAELLNALEDLKVYTRENLDDLLNAITQIEVLMKEGIPVSDNLIEKLKVLLHRIEMEVQYRGDV